MSLCGNTLIFKNTNTPNIIRTLCCRKVHFIFIRAQFFAVCIDTFVFASLRNSNGCMLWWVDVAINSTVEVWPVFLQIIYSNPDKGLFSVWILNGLVFKWLLVYLVNWQGCPFEIKQLGFQMVFIFKSCDKADRLQRGGGEAFCDNRVLGLRRKCTTGGLKIVKICVTSVINAPLLELL